MTDALDTDAPQWPNTAPPDPGDLRHFAVYAQHGDASAVHVVPGDQYPSGAVTATLADVAGGAD